MWMNLVNKIRIMSEKAIELIKEFEELRLEAYLCPAGVWTIGWGHTKGVKPGMKITEEQAEELLEEDMQEAIRVVERLNVDLSDNQYNALVSFVFNIGGSAFARSTIRRKILVNPNDKTIRAELMRWVYADGKMLKGLERRREEEAELYFL
jgi:lysozyme